MHFFPYSENLLNDCANEKLGGKSQVDGGACEKLFRQHAKHFDREDADISSLRFNRFLNSVLQVHDHNKRHGNTHRIGLNQFSDRYNDELPLTSFDNTSLLDALESLDESTVVNLSSHERILDAAGGIYNQRRRNGVIREHHSFELNSFDPKHRWETLNSSNVQKQHHVIGSIPNLSTKYTAVADEKFENYLNWATTENPDGVSIVNPPSNQGSCGSCWAFAATGTLEASLSRRFAYKTYIGFMKARANALDAEAEGLAQEAEQAAINVADLSVQELIDCDTKVDQGCTGGNPLLAFDFIHRYGLTSSKGYPYQGQQNTCRFQNVANPIATVQSWGMLTPDYEDNMELVLRLIGPIAVGLNGFDPNFLAYKSGIYHSLDCGEVANHALLIVGYGQEVDKDGDRFWIARNSWGESWGEDGYVRIKRGDGKLGDKSTCGIAKGPSVALGGTLLPNSGVQTNLEHRLRASSDSSAKVLEQSLHSNYCRGLAFGDFRSCDRIKSVIQVCPIIVFFAIAFFTIFALTLAGSFRAISRRRENRQRSEQVERNDDVPSQNLLCKTENQKTYGTNHAII